MTGLWSSIKAGPRRRGGAWEKVRRNEIWIRMWAKERNEILCVRQSPEEPGLRGGEGPDTMEGVGAEDKGAGGMGRVCGVPGPRIGRSCCLGWGCGHLGDGALMGGGGALTPALATASRPAPQCGTR